MPLRMSLGPQLVGHGYVGGDRTRPAGGECPVHDVGGELLLHTVIVREPVEARARMVVDQVETEALTTDRHDGMLRGRASTLPVDPGVSGREVDRVSQLVALGGR